MPPLESQCLLVVLGGALILFFIILLDMKSAVDVDSCTFSVDVDQTAFFSVDVDQTAVFYLVVSQWCRCPFLLRFSSRPIYEH